MQRHIPLSKLEQDAAAYGAAHYRDIGAEQAMLARAYIAGANHVKPTDNMGDRFNEIMPKYLELKQKYIRLKRKYIAAMKALGKA